MYTSERTAEKQDKEGRPTADAGDCTAAVAENCAASAAVVVCCVTPVLMSASFLHGFFQCGGPFLKTSYGGLLFAKNLSPLKRFAENVSNCRISSNALLMWK